MPQSANKPTAFDAKGAIEQVRELTLKVAQLRRQVDEIAARSQSYERIVAVGLLTSADLELLGPTLKRVWPVEEAPSYSELIRAIDDADRQLILERKR